MIEDRITQAFETIKVTLRQEVDVMLDNTQKTLNDLSDRRGRHEAQTEAEHKRNQAIRQEILQILGYAQGLSKQLLEISNV